MSALVLCFAHYHRMKRIGRDFRARAIALACDLIADVPLPQRERRNK